MPDFDLLLAYCRTDYCVDARGTAIVVRVGQRCAKLDHELTRRGVSPWAFITAWNPGSKPLADKENARRQAMLEEAVRNLKLDFDHGAGVSDDSLWTPEESLCVYGIEESVAIDLATRFEQNAIVVGTPGGKPTLRFTQPKGWKEAVRTGIRSPHQAVRDVCRELAEKYEWGDL